MKTKLLIKTSFFNKVNDFLCFDIIKYIFNRRSNYVFISYIIKINTFCLRVCGLQLGTLMFTLMFKLFVVVV